MGRQVGRTQAAMKLIHILETVQVRTAQNYESIAVIEPIGVDTSKSAETAHLADESEVMSGKIVALLGHFPLPSLGG